MVMADALDTNSPKSAIVSCNKLLKKYPKSELIKVLYLMLFFPGGGHGANRAFPRR